ncbi:hypothetical protein KQI46_10725 [Lysinibacillus capsici]|nr:hypothetical protein [Lysinibacillus capsici]MBU5252393.1 hypothetical protein [Lysinibacillus capsici]
MSKIEIKEDKVICTVEGSEHKSEVIITASAITMGTLKITSVGDHAC